MKDSSINPNSVRIISKKTSKNIYIVCLLYSSLKLSLLNLKTEGYGSPQTGTIALPDLIYEPLTELANDVDDGLSSAFVRLFLQAHLQFKIVEITVDPPSDIKSPSNVHVDTYVFTVRAHVPMFIQIFNF